MSPDAQPQPEACNCLALRQAARHVTQFYDRYLVPTGVRTTQFSILAKLGRAGPMTIFGRRMCGGPRPGKAL